MDVEEEVETSMDSEVWANAPSENTEEMDSKRIALRNKAPSFELFLKQIDFNPIHLLCKVWIDGRCIKHIVV